MWKNKETKEKAERGKKLSIKRISSQDICIGIGIVLCLFICYFVPQIQRLAACTAVLMCIQDSEQATFRSGLTRLEGVICGGIAGILVVLLDGVIQKEFVFYLLCGIGIILNLFLCKLVGMIPVTQRVSGITFCLVVFLLQGNGRIYYAASRLIGTLAGAAVALVIILIWRGIQKIKPSEH